MSDRDLLRLDRLDLADAVDHLLNKGAVLTCDMTLSLAGVDLVYVGLNVLIASVETLREVERTPPPAPPPADARRGEPGLTGMPTLTDQQADRRRVDAGNFSLYEPPPLRAPAGGGGRESCSCCCHHYLDDWHGVIRRRTNDSDHCRRGQWYAGVRPAIRRMGAPVANGVRLGRD